MTGMASRGAACLSLKIFRRPPVIFISVAAMPFKMPARIENEKRAITDVASPQQQTALKKAKLPPADSDLVALESAAKKPAARRLPATAPLNICVYKSTSKAGDIWSQLESPLKFKRQLYKRPGVSSGVPSPGAVMNGIASNKRELPELSCLT